MKVQSIIVTITMGVLFFLQCACSSGESGEKASTVQNTTNVSTVENLPLNMSIYIDLSDRINRQHSGMSQKSIDIKIINYLVEQFVNITANRGVLMSKNNFQVLFYPAPDDPNVNELAQTMSADLSKMKAGEKKLAMQSLGTNVNNSLEAIYDKTIMSKNWQGCDIWSFFSDKKVDNFCIKPGYRNVLIILTDGYLFHTKNKVKDGNAYSYVLDQMLAVPESSLIVKRSDLENIEVLMLEVAPNSPKIRDRLFDVLNDWFKNMGLSKENYSIQETDLPKNTQLIIDNFLNK